MQGQLLLLLHLQLLDQFEGCGLIVAHVLVPSLRELLKLHLLSSFNVDELFFLGKPHVLFLALLFCPREFLEA